MNILFVTISWPPIGERNLYTDLIDEFRERGHSITVLNGSGNQQKQPYIYENNERLNVIKVKTGKISKTNPIRKFVSLVTLNKKMNRAYEDHLSQNHFDLILFATPPITLSGFLARIKKINEAKLYLLLKDIWPHGFADLGAIRRDGLIWKFFRWHEIRIYRLSDHIGCMSPLGVEFVMKENPEIPPEKLEVCPNSIRIPLNRSEKNNEIRYKYNIPIESTVFLFSGNLGRGHGLDFLVRNIVSLDKYKKAFFLIGGAGTHFNKVKVSLINAHVSNVMVYDYLPREDFELLCANCDVGIILLDKSYSYPQFPSRLLAYLANKMAVICAINKETDIGKIVEENQCGLSSIHGNDYDFQQNIRHLCEQQGVRIDMSENAWNLLVSQYDVRITCEIILSKFELMAKIK